MKQNKKQIEANLRNKMAAQYKAKTDDLQERIVKLEKRLKEANERAHQAELEKLDMKDKLQQYEDWNRRLQECMDMSEEDRKKYVENLRADTEYAEKMKRLGNKIDFFDHLFGLTLFG